MTTKIFRYLVDNKKRKVMLRAFRIWQHTPAKIAPLSETASTCASCGTEFQGNYCPRCGQSATVGRFSLGKTILLFLDEWGLGNRNLLFRCLRDLMFRPGYMIRDYLSGMQSAYFSPFKLFFLLTAISLIVEQGLRLDTSVPAEQQVETNTAIAEKPEEPEGMGEAETKWEADEEFYEEGDTLQVTSGEKGASKDARIILKTAERFGRLLKALMNKNPALFALLILVLFSSPMFLFFRSSPNIPRLKFSEFILALVYTADVFSIYSLAGDLLNLNIFYLIALLMIFVALRQLLGFKMRRLLWYMVLSSLISGILLMLLITAGVLIVYWLS